ncbi:MAG: LysE family translocator, partial [Rhodobacteraceae bacterium]|nr:LysE family translocator [Paracoccaceae bacterium]
WIGAAYLVLLGVKLFRSAGTMEVGHLPDGRSGTPRAVFTHAAVVTALNPKSIVFFIAFVPQFLRPDAPLAPQFSVLIATFVTLATLNALAYALLADHMRQRIRQTALLRGLARLGGGMLVAMGLVTVALRRHS